MILGILFGAVLGMRFKVFALFPAIAVGIALTAIATSMKGVGLWSALIAVALISIGLQVGFLVGAMIRCLMAASRAPASRRAADRALSPSEKSPSQSIHRFPAA